MNSDSSLVKSIMGFFLFKFKLNCLDNSRMSRFFMYCLLKLKLILKRVDNFEKE